MRIPLHKARGLLRPSGLYCNIDVSALAAVLFVLVFAMTILKNPPYHGIAVEMPRVSHPVSWHNAIREDVLEVAIFRDGTIFFGVEKVNPEDLPKKLKDGLAAGSERKVYIRADTHAQFGSVREVLDGIGLAGIEKVSFITESRR